MAIALSIVVPCYNQRRTIEGLLASLEQQTADKGLFEVIVCDSGSNDGSVQFVREYRGGLAIQAAIGSGRLSRAATRNMGLALLRGSTGLFLDGDMKASPGLVERHLKAQEALPAVYMGIVYPCAELQDNVFHWYRTGRGANKMREGVPLPPKYFRTNNASVPMAMLRKAGRFNEAYTEWGGEDIEMGYALQRCNASFYLVSEAMAFHDHDETIDEYVRKMGRYAQTGLKLLVENCPEFAAQGYMALFRENPVWLRLLFEPFIYWIFYALRKLPLPRSVAFRIYDYITYYHIYHGMRG